MRPRYLGPGACWRGGRPGSAAFETSTTVPPAARKALKASMAAGKVQVASWRDAEDVAQEDRIGTRDPAKPRMVSGSSATVVTGTGLDDRGARALELRQFAGRRHGDRQGAGLPAHDRTIRIDLIEPLHQRRRPAQPPWQDASCTQPRQGSGKARTAAKGAVSTIPLPTFAQGVETLAGAAPVDAGLDGGAGRHPHRTDPAPARRAGRPAMARTSGSPMAITSVCANSCANRSNIPRR